MAIRFRLKKFWLGFCLILALISSLIGLMAAPQVVQASGIPQRWEANQYKPPEGLGAPTRTTGAGTRGSTNSCPVAGKPLTALLPSSQFGATVAAYPSFLVYLPTLSPPTASLPVEFLLEDASGNEVYKANFQALGTSGIIAINLPTQAGLAPLAIGQDYKWSFSMICQGTERTADTTVQGGVRRVALNSTLSNQLKQTSVQKQVELYAEAELWQDALATLAQLHRDYPRDSAIAQTWSKLLTAAGLDNLAQESLITGSKPS